MTAFKIPRHAEDEEHCQPFTLYKGNQSWTINLLAEAESRLKAVWQLAHRLGRHFQLSVVDDERGEGETPTIPSVSSQIELACAFMAFVAEQTRQKADQNSLTTHYELLYCAYCSVERQYLGHQKGNIFTLASQTHNPEQVVSQILLSTTTLQASSLDHALTSRIRCFGPSSSALLHAAATGDVRLVATFGGQGANLTYFDELRYIFHAYRPVVEVFLRDLSDVLQVLVSQSRSYGLDAAHRMYGIRLYSWLTDTDTTPPNAYLASVPVAAVLIAVVQLTYCVLISRMLNLNHHGELVQTFQSSIGHSQGLICSVALASSTSETGSFERNAIKAINLLFWMSVRASEVSTSLQSSTHVVQSQSMDGAFKTPMVFVAGLSRSALQAHIDKANVCLDIKNQEARRLAIRISLINGPQAFVVTGEPVSLSRLCQTLEALASPESASNEAAGRFRRRSEQIRVVIRQLPVDVPFHHPALAECVEKVIEWDLNLRHQEEFDYWRPEDLAMPIYDTVDGSNMQRHNNAQQSLVRRIVTQILIEPVDWTATVRAAMTGRPTHFLDLGPGRDAGVGSMTNRLVEGQGAKAVVVGKKISSSPSPGQAPGIWDSDHVRYADHWASRFAPKLRRQGGTVFVSTRFSELVRKPPVMVAGMTPTTCSPKLVAAVLQAGYHIELGSGNMYSREDLRRAVMQTIDLAPAGACLTLNVLYLAPRYFKLLLEEWISLRLEGFPIEGVTIAGGVPSVTEAVEMISRLKAAKLRHISFKPSSATTISQIVKIAQAEPRFPIIVQWTGGRAGGHHSNEDQFQPLLSTYASLRRMDNVSIVVGGGISTPDEANDWLSGRWSETFGVPRMPVDGVLLGTALTVVAEAETSDEVKQRIVQAEGCEDHCWDRTYNGVVGGVLTAISEFGEPIHLLANRAARLWKELDMRLFSLPRGKAQELYLKDNASYLISRLNSDYCRPWFCIDKDGQNLNGLSEMTYEDLVRRFVNLSRSQATRVWIDLSWRKLAQKLVVRVEERFLSRDRAQSGPAYISLEQSEGTDTEEIVEQLFTAYPTAKQETVSHEDCTWFIQLCASRGHKPVPFIPSLDEHFETFFKKDTIWQWENLDAVSGRDAERVICLTGPVAVKACQQSNIPVQVLLDNFQNSFLEEFGLQHENKVEINSPTSTDLGVSLEQLNSLPSSSMPLWLYNLVHLPHVVRGKRIYDNPVKLLCEQHPNLFAQYETGASGHQVVFLLQNEHTGHQWPILRITGSPGETEGQMHIIISLLIQKDSSQLPLDFHYLQDLNVTWVPMQEAQHDRNQRIRSLFHQLWCGDALIRREEVDGNTLFVGKATVSHETAHASLQIIKTAGIGSDGAEISIGLGFFLGWRSIAAALLGESKDDDLLTLVHLSNQTRRPHGAQRLLVGEEVVTTSKVIAVTLGPGGKTVKVHCLITDTEANVQFEVESCFLYRGAQHAIVHKEQKEFSYELQICSEEDKAILISRPWLRYSDTDELQPGTKLLFRITAYTRFDTLTQQFYARSIGTAHKLGGDANASKHVADVFSETTSDCVQPDQVIAFFERHGEASDQPVMLERPRLIASDVQITMPASNEEYAAFSMDTNPLHTSPTFAVWAGVNGLVTHGMHSHGRSVDLISKIVAGSASEMIESFTCSFTAMIFLNEVVTFQLQHTGMQQGKLIINIEGRKSNGEKAIVGTALVKPRKAAYIFTGQGSQHVGMGQNLYQSSKIARTIWNRADRHCIKCLGFSLLEIVRNNPKHKTIFFQGSSGADLRKRYVRMGYMLPQKGGIKQRVAFFPSINARTAEFRFENPTGLLFLTQFGQVAITVLEYAIWSELTERQIALPDSWAGHSAGEFAALSAVGNAFSLEELIDTMWMRGLLMLHTVPRTKNAPEYAMMAVNPSRIGQAGKFQEQELEDLTATIEQVTGGLCQVVNYNVKHEQYVVAGNRCCLALLANVMADITLITPNDERSSERLTQALWDQMDTEGRKDPILERTLASVPLPGIDMPFHSRLLGPAVGPFRSFLLDKLDLDNFCLENLEHRWMPNVVGRPFEVTKEYLCLCHDITSSDVLGKLIANWDSLNTTLQGKKKLVGYYLLVELMAYQIASPVQWIDCQFQLLQCGTIIEIGPSSILTKMASQTIKRQYNLTDHYNGIQRSLLCVSRFEEEVYRAISGTEDKHHGQSNQDLPPPTLVAKPPPPSSMPTDNDDTHQHPAPSSAVSGTTSLPARSMQKDAGPTSLIDEALSAVLHLRIVIAFKLRKSLIEVTPDSTIKQLTGGRSVLMNELVSDLEEEFGGFPERGEELPLADAAISLSSTAIGRPGKTSLRWLRTSMQATLPATLENPSDLRNGLQKYGLGPLRARAALLLVLLYAPKSRLTEAQSKEWLGEIVQHYCDEVGVQLSDENRGEQSNTQKIMSTMNNSAEFAGFVKDEEDLHQKHLLALKERLHQDDHLAHQQTQESSRRADDLAAKLDSISHEHGEVYLEGIKAKFYPSKVRSFASSWSWSSQALQQCIHDDKGVIGPTSNAIDRQAFLEDVVRKFDLRLLPEINYALVHHRTAMHGDVIAVFERLAQNDCTAWNTSFIPAVDNVRPVTTVSKEGHIDYSEVPRRVDNRFHDYIAEICTKRPTVSANLTLTRSRKRTNGIHKSSMKKTTFQLVQPDKPLVTLKWSKDTHDSTVLTKAYCSTLLDIALNGLDLSNRNVLLLGAGAGSIGEELLGQLLQAGANVVVTTSSASKPTFDRFKAIYQARCSSCTTLHVAPFNMASLTDVSKLVEWIYSKEGPGLDLDFIIPFAAISEAGREITSLDDHCEVAHRAMLTNTIRLVGAVCQQKAQRDVRTRPARLLLPLSPNHGLFGGDGLYSESKVGLEMLLHKWGSETWADYVQVVGATIGWTRGTRLMDQMNIVAQGFESMHPKARTFSVKEMAVNLLTLLHNSFERFTREGSITVDLSGGMKEVDEVGKKVKALRSSLQRQAKLMKLLAAEEQASMTIKSADRNAVPITQRAAHSFHFPTLSPTVESRIPGPLTGLVDLAKTAVIVGFAEVGPYGSSRTRWEAELGQQWSTEAWIELGFLMGLIRFVNTRLKDGTMYIGWSCSKTMEPVADADVADRFGEQIRKNCGIRAFDDESLTAKGFLPIKIKNDLAPIEMSVEDARFVQSKYGDAVTVTDKEEGKHVQLRKGAELLVSRSASQSRFVGGLLPQGWDARRLGIPQNRCESIDRAATWALSATADAFASAGIEDPYELFRHVHITEVGNAIGSAMGGLKSSEEMYQDRTTGQMVQSDILQETFINSIGAWVQLLFLSASGPILTPTAACATGATSLAIGKLAIERGDAKVMLCGAFDDLTATSSAEFGNMKATMDNTADLSHGRLAEEASRPFASDRAGFTEAQGGGVQILMSAELAIKLGLPIYGVVAMAATATDKQGNSIPAPGKGLLSLVSEPDKPQEHWSNAFSLERRREESHERMIDIEAYAQRQILRLHRRFSTSKQGQSDLRALAESISAEIDQRERDYAVLPAIARDASLLRRSLATFGLAADDIAFISCHGTATQAGDLNECGLHDHALSKLGRSPGKPCPLVAQKNLVGHAKGGASTWAVNGALQALMAGIVPGNHRLDDVDERMKAFTNLLFISENIRLPSQGGQACLIASMGFGQAGAELCIVAGKVLLQNLGMTTYDAYRTRNAARFAISKRLLTKMLHSENGWTTLKDQAPYKPEHHQSVLLDKTCRAEKEIDMEMGEAVYRIDPNVQVERSTDTLQQQKRIATIWQPECSDLMQGANEVIANLLNVNVDQVAKQEAIISPSCELSGEAKLVAILEKKTDCIRVQVYASKAIRSDQKSGILFTAICLATPFASPSKHGLP